MKKSSGIIQEPCRPTPRVVALALKEWHLLSKEPSSEEAFALCAFLPLAQEPADLACVIEALIRHHVLERAGSSTRPTVPVEGVMGKAPSGHPPQSTREPPGSSRRCRQQLAR